MVSANQTRISKTKLANLIEIIEQQMTPAQIAEAQKRARECVAREYKGC